MPTVNIGLGMMWKEKKETLQNYITKFLFHDHIRAQDRSKFSPVHLNHADKGTTACNVIRLLEDDRVAFFSSRDIFAGEELCFDYGSNFWKGREHLIV